MNEYTIFRKCLSMFNIELSKNSYENKDNEQVASHELQLCNLWLESAFLRAMRESKWTFLTSELNFKNILPSTEYNHKNSSIGEETLDHNGYPIIVAPHFFGYHKAYKITDDFYEIIDVLNANNRHDRVLYKAYGDTIYTDTSNVIILGIKKLGLEEYKAVPQEFEDMVAYALALLIAPSIAPKDMNIQQLINTQYSWATDRLYKVECNSNIRRIYHEELE